MSVLYLNVCRLCAPNIMSSGTCFKQESPAVADEPARRGVM